MPNATSPFPKLTDRLTQLDALLQETKALWQPQPFKGTPPWVEAHPTLTHALLSLSDQEVAHYTQGGSDLRQWITKQLPHLSELDSLCQLTAAPTRAKQDTSPHLLRDIPGRKLAQIEAFANSIQTVQHPLLEWCGGKGHLGRILALHYIQPVTTLEINAILCEAGHQLATRAGIQQRFIAQSVLEQEASSYLPGQHVVALHACGELHRHLVKQAVNANTPALTIAPCCYHLWANEQYTPFNDHLKLQLRADDLRLAVTQTATAHQREITKRNQEMAWKLGFNQLRQDLFGNGYQPLKPINKQWLTLNFETFCQQLAQRENIYIPSSTDWDSYETIGWQQQAKVIRLNLLRSAFSRAIELWIVYDMAVWLEQQGYKVSANTFCDEAVTPRNLIIQATKRV